MLKNSNCIFIKSKCEKDTLKSWKEFSKLTLMSNFNFYKKNSTELKSILNRKIRFSYNKSWKVIVESNIFWGKCFLSAVPTDWDDKCRYVCSSDVYEIVTLFLKEKKNFNATWTYATLWSSDWIALIIVSPLKELLIKKSEFCWG